MKLTSRVKNRVSSLSWQPVTNLSAHRRTWTRRKAVSCFYFFLSFLLIGPSCRHIKKGTEQTLLKKLSGNSNWTSCQDCGDDENKENVNADAHEQDEEEQGTQVAWLCLKCGHRVSLHVHTRLVWHVFAQILIELIELFRQGCGRYSENQHAIRHYETPRSDPHCLVINLDTWAVW